MRAMNSSRDSFGVDSMTSSSVREKNLPYPDPFPQIAPGKVAAPFILAFMKNLDIGSLIGSTVELAFELPK